MDEGRFIDELRPFRRGELALARATAAGELALPPRELALLRYALRLAQLPALGPEPLDLLDRLAGFRLRLLQRLAPVLPTGPGAIDAAALHGALPEVLRLASEARRSVREAGVAEAALDAEIAEKRLALVLGGAGGCGYVYLGVLERLEELGLRPSYLLGCSIGSILAVLRARSAGFELAELLAEIRLLRTVSALGPPRRARFGLPGALRIDLHRALAPFFARDDGTPASLGELAIPVDALATGLRQPALGAPPADAAGWLDPERDEPARRTLTGRALASAVAALIALAASRRVLVPELLGADPETAQLPALDAAGFSSAIPGVLQYDLPPDDARNAARLDALFERDGLVALVDGLLASAVPARLAWQTLEEGRIGTRHAAIVALHALEAPQRGAQALLSPLQHAFASTSQRDRAFWDLRVTFRRAPGLFDFLPGEPQLRRAIETGRQEFEAAAGWLQGFLARVPRWREFAPARAGKAGRGRAIRSKERGIPAADAPPRAEEDAWRATPTSRSRQRKRAFSPSQARTRRCTPRA